MQNLNASLPAGPEAVELEAAVGNRALRPPIKTGLKIPGIPETGFEPFRFAAPRGRLLLLVCPPVVEEEEAEAAKAGEPRSMPRAFLREKIFAQALYVNCLGG